MGCEIGGMKPLLPFPKEAQDAPGRCMGSQHLRCLAAKRIKNVHTVTCLILYRLPCIHGSLGKMVPSVPKSPNATTNVRRDMESQFNKEMDTATGEGMKEEIASRGKGVKDKFAELGRQALETIDAQREPAASTLGIGRGSPQC